MFYKILSMIPQDAPAISPKYEWGINDVPANSTRINLAAGYTASDTSIVVADSYPIVKNSLLYVSRTGELIYVSAAPTYSSHTLGTVVRGVAGTAAAALVDGDELTFLGDQLPELADANLGNGSEPGDDFNYIQRISKSFTVSELQENSAMVDGVGQVPYESIRKMLEAKRNINAALLFSKRARIVSPVGSSDGYLYMTDSIYSKVTQNVLDLTGVNGALKWPVLNHFFRTLFNATASSPTKVLLVGENLFAAFSRLSWDRFNFRTQPESTLGTRVTEVRTDEGGIVQIVLDKYGFSGAKAGEGAVVDLAHVRLKEMSGEPLRWKPNIQDNDAHVRKDEIFGSFSLKLKFPETMGIIKGASGQV
jgi:hypothetical protein